MKRQFFFFFPENYSIHSEILETYYFGIVAISTCLWHSNWVLNSSDRTSGAPQMTTSRGKISTVKLISALTCTNRHGHGNLNRNTHIYTQSGLCFLWNVFLDWVLGNCPLWKPFDNLPSLKYQDNLTLNAFLV